MPQIMRTSNPALGDKTFNGLPSSLDDISNRMTLNGTVNKTGILLVLAIVSAGWTWLQFAQTRDVSTITPWMMLGGLGGFIAAMVTIFKKQWAPVTAPIYAVLEGLLLGGISAVFELRYPGIAFGVGSADLWHAVCVVVPVSHRDYPGDGKIPAGCFCRYRRDCALLPAADDSRTLPL